MSVVCLASCVFGEKNNNDENDKKLRKTLARHVNSTFRDVFWHYLNNMT